MTGALTGLQARHFIWLADVLHSTRSHMTEEGRFSFDRDDLSKICDDLASGNPRFDRTAFMRVVTRATVL